MPVPLEAQLNCSLDGFPFSHSFLVIPSCPIPLLRRDVLQLQGATLQVTRNPTPSSSLILLLLENPPPPLPSPSFPTVLTPQLMHYGEGELRDKLTRHREKRAVFLPMLVGLTFTTTLAAAGIGSAGLAHSLQTTRQLWAELEQALDASAISLASLQRQITSVAQVALQNRRALDLLMAEKGGTCLFLQKQCCLYVNESGVVAVSYTHLRAHET